VKDVITKEYTLLSEVEDTSAPIPNMDSNVNYTIGVSILNSANIESDKATTTFISRKFYRNVAVFKIVNLVGAY
jgi:hypothetical protein